MPSIFTEKPDPLVLRLRLAGVRGRLFVWLPAIVAIGVIATESTGTFSSDNTSHFLRPLFEGVFGHIREELWSLEHHIFRKTGHFVGYGLVCFLRAWLLTLGCVADMPHAAWRWRSAGLGLLSTFLVASADEYHQTFLPGRTGMFSDVLLDTSGGLLMCVLVWFFFWRNSRRQPSGTGRVGQAQARGLA